MEKAVPTVTDLTPPCTTWLTVDLNGHRGHTMLPLVLMADYGGLEKPDWGDQLIAKCQLGQDVHKELKTKSTQYTTPSTQARH